MNPTVEPATETPRAIHADLCIKSAYAPLLNRLSQMQDAVCYAVARTELSQAEMAIVTLEQHLTATRAELEKAQQKQEQRDGNWLDKWGCCKVCDGEIPHGHMPNCDLFKLEMKEHEANQKCQEAERQAGEMRATIQRNHKWHQDYDEYDGYPDSELCTDNEHALSSTCGQGYKSPEEWAGLEARYVNTVQALQEHFGLKCLPMQTARFVCDEFTNLKAERDSLQSRLAKASEVETGLRETVARVQDEKGNRIKDLKGKLMLAQDDLSRMTTELEDCQRKLITQCARVGRIVLERDTALARNEALEPALRKLIAQAHGAMDGARSAGGRSMDHIESWAVVKQTAEDALMSSPAKD